MARSVMRVGGDKASRPRFVITKGQRRFSSSVSLVADLSKRQHLFVELFAERFRSVRQLLVPRSVGSILGGLFADFQDRRPRIGYTPESINIVGEKPAVSSAVNAAAMPYR